MCEDENEWGKVKLDSVKQEKWRQHKFKGEIEKWGKAELGVALKCLHVYESHLLRGTEQCENEREREREKKGYCRIRLGYSYLGTMLRLRPVASLWKQILNTSESEYLCAKKHEHGISGSWKDQCPGALCPKSTVIMKYL